MPRIIPIKDLKNTSEISEMCHKADEPIYITKNGYGDMVIMSMENYEETIHRLNVFKELEVSEQQISEGRTKDARSSLVSMRERYGL
ncbi:MAG: type II toxin-antitoxin system Phd/YefM family antitoxin [Lachnospiraceae bacterium]|nr:type II toxin-antitoxin system Phd/YefM family antitoxin [Lachnospiraceae bacterium]